MKYILEYLREMVKVQPLGEVTTVPYEATCGEYVGEAVLIDGKEVGITIYYIDYINWLESKDLNMVSVD